MPLLNRSAAYLKMEKRVTLAAPVSLFFFFAFPPPPPFFLSFFCFFFSAFSLSGSRKCRRGSLWCCVVSVSSFRLVAYTTCHSFTFPLSPHTHTLSHWIRFKEAVEDAEKVVKMRPEYAPAHGTLAVASYGQKDFIGARRSYAKALELSPGNADYEAGVKASEEATEDAKDAARKAVRPRPALQDCATLRRFRALSLINIQPQQPQQPNPNPLCPPHNSSPTAPPPAPTPSTHSP